jgi:hypothetical protein
MTNKNPFEIRTELLEMAKDYMDRQHEYNVQFAERAKEAGHQTMEQCKESYKMYSMEDLMEKAKDMYTFVSKKD